MDGSPLASLIFVAFIAGIGRGSVVCLQTCGPALGSYVACETKTGWRGGLLAALRFNGARVLIMTLFGALVGYLIGTAVFTWFQDVMSGLYFIGYFILGIYAIFLGVTLYRQSGCGPMGRVIHGLQGLLISERGVALSMGSILGVACLIEITVLEGTILGAAAGLFGAADGVSTALTGAMAMLAFGIGSSVPMTVALSGAGALSKRLHASPLEGKLRSIMGVALIVVGGLLAMGSLEPLLLLIQG